MFTLKIIFNPFYFINILPSLLFSSFPPDTYNRTHNHISVSPVWKKLWVLRKHAILR